ncbi:MAG: hypothetical protein IPH20_20455 [Bacteroidales bacterium]|nr:hypothetical protein [Bacteroidales bacterium]
MVQSGNQGEGFSELVGVTPVFFLKPRKVRLFVIAQLETDFKYRHTGIQ